MRREEGMMKLVRWKRIMKWGRKRIMKWGRKRIMKWGRKKEKMID